MLSRSATPAGGVATDVKMISSVSLFGEFGQRTVISGDVRGLTAYARAAEIVSESVACLPWHVFKRNGADRERVKSHPVDRLLNDVVSDYKPSYEWRVQIGMDLFYHGNSVTRIVYDNSGLPTSLEHMDWYQVGIQKIKGQKYYVHYSEDEGIRTYAEREVLHFRCTDKDPSTGLGRSPIQKFAATFGEVRDTRDMARQNAENGGYLRGVIEGDHPLKAGMGPRMADSWRKNYLNKHNTGGVAVLEGGFKYKPLSASFKDAQHVELRQFHIAEVSRITGVPPHLLSSLDKATFNNIYELSLSFVKYKLAPWAKALEAELVCKLFTPTERLTYFTEHNFNGLLQASPKERAEHMNALFNTGAISPNMIAQLENLPGFEGGDERYVMSNMMRVSDVPAIGDNPPTDTPPKTKKKDA